MNMQSHIRDMALCLIADELARRQDAGDSDILIEIESLTRSQEDICDTVPLVLKKYGVTLDEAIEELAPVMEALVKDIDTLWGGKLTMAQLAEEFDDGIYTTQALASLGHGVSLSDDNEIEKFIESHGSEVPHGHYIDDTAVFNAAFLVEDALALSLEREQEV